MHSRDGSKPPATRLAFGDMAVHLPGPRSACRCWSQAAAAARRWPSGTPKRSIQRMARRESSCTRPPPRTRAGSKYVVCLPSRSRRLRSSTTASEPPRCRSLSFRNWTSRPACSALCRSRVERCGLLPALGSSQAWAIGPCLAATRCNRSRAWRPDYGRLYDRAGRGWQG